MVSECEYRNDVRLMIVNVDDSGHIMTREPLVCKVVNNSESFVVLTRDSPSFFPRILRTMSCETKQMFRKINDVDDMNYVVDIHRRKFNVGPRHVPAFPVTSSIGITSGKSTLRSDELDESGVELIEPTSSPLKLPSVQSPSKPLNLVSELKRSVSDAQVIDSPTSPDAKGEDRRQNPKRAKSCTK